MTDPSMPPDLDRLLGAATVPAMPVGLVDRIVAEAQRPDRAALSVAPPRRAHARVWTRRGMRTGIVAVSLMLATAVAAAFGGGGTFGVARLRAVVQHVVERVRHPFHHAPPVHPVVHRMTVPRAAIRVAPVRIAPALVPSRVPALRPAVSAPMPVRTAMAPAPARGSLPRGTPVERIRGSAHPLPRFAAAHPFARRPRDRSFGTGRAGRRETGADRVSAAAPIAPRVEPYLPATALPRAPDAASHGDGEAQFEGPRWRDPARFGDAQGPRGLGWRRRMAGGGQAADGAGAPNWRRRPGSAAGMRMRPFRPGGGGRRPPRRF